jgi:hypothetical protein
MPRALLRYPFVPAKAVTQSPTRFPAFAEMDGSYFIDRFHDCR